MEWDLTLSQSLVATTPDETSGSRSANRFDYQLNWAFSHLISLYSAQNDFVIVLDYHDDVLVLDSAASPTKVECFQIKTKTSGRWTVSSLLKRKRGERGPKRSILGKLYSHYIRWGNEVSALVFASNSGLSATNASGQSTDQLDVVPFGALEPSLVLDVSTKLAAECNLSPPATPQLALMRFDKLSLQPVGHGDQCLGQVATFLAATAQTEHIPAPAFFRTVKSAMLRAAHYEGCPATFAELCKSKALTRAQFNRMLSDAAVEPRRSTQHITLQNRLDSEHVAFGEVLVTVREAQRFNLLRMDPSNKLLYDDIEIISSISINNLDTPRLWDVIQATKEQLARINPDIIARHSNAGITGMIGVIVCEQIQLSAVNSQSTEKNP